MSENGVVLACRGLSRLNVLVLVWCNALTAARQGVRVPSTDAYLWTLQSCDQHCFVWGLMCGAPCHHRVRSIGSLKEEDASLAPSNGKSEGGVDNVGGVTAVKRAKTVEGNTKEVGTIAMLYTRGAQQ